MTRKYPLATDDPARDASEKALEELQAMGDERSTVPPGSYKQARGIIPWQEGDELPEVSIRRLRGDTSDLERRIADLEATVAELKRRLDDLEGEK